MTKIRQDQFNLTRLKVIAHPTPPRFVNIETGASPATSAVTSRAEDGWNAGGTVGRKQHGSRKKEGTKKEEEGEVGGYERRERWQKEERVGWIRGTEDTTKYGQRD